MRHVTSEPSQICFDEFDHMCSLYNLDKIFFIWICSIKKLYLFIVTNGTIWHEGFRSISLQVMTYWQILRLLLTLLGNIFQHVKVVTLSKLAYGVKNNAWWMSISLFGTNYTMSDTLNVVLKPCKNNVNTFQRRCYHGTTGTNTTSYTSFTLERFKKWSVMVTDCNKILSCICIYIFDLNGSMCIL